jgi:hypothetical protein
MTKPMHEKAPTKSELHEMLAEALRNRAQPTIKPLLPAAATSDGERAAAQ